LAIHLHVDDVAENVSQNDGKTQAVQGLQPDGRYQLRTAQLPARFNPEQHDQRQSESCQQQLTDDGDQAEIAPKTRCTSKHQQGHQPEQ